MNKYLEERKETLRLEIIALKEQLGKKHDEFMLVDNLIDANHTKEYYEKESEEWAFQQRKKAAEWLQNKK